MVEILACLESSTRMGLDDLNYDSIWDHSKVVEEEEVAEEEMEEEEEVAKEEVAYGDELEEVTEASTRSSRSQTHNYDQVEDAALCYA